MKTKWHYPAILLLSISSTLHSCQKNADLNSGSENPVTPEKFRELTTAPAFNWKNERPVTLRVVPLNVPDKISNTIQVLSDTDSSVVFTGRCSMNEGLIKDLILPATATKVVVTFGSFRKTVTITNNIIQFDFLETE